MSSASPVRLPKRRRDNIDEKIEALSKVINTMTGSKKSFLQAKLNNIKLKKHKLVALSLCRSQEPSNQNLVTEFELMIAENDIDIEIESIRSSKKFKRTENMYLESLFRDPHARENRAYNSTPKNASTSYDISAITVNSPGNSPQNSRQNVLNTQKNAPMCDKTTNTDPVHILNAIEFIPAVARKMSSKEATMHIVDENISPIKHIPCKEKLPTEVNTSPAPLKEITSTAEESNSQKEKLLRESEYTFLQNSEENIQSNWFESSFELEVFLNEKPEASRKSEGSFKDTSVSESTEKGYTYKIYRRKRKSLEAEASSVQTSTTEMAQNLTKDSTTIPTENMSGNGNVEKTKNVALSKSKTVTLPSGKAVETLPDVFVALPDATVALPEVAVVLPEATIALPEATIALPEANYSHKTITNIFEAYKEIYKSDNVTTSKIPQSRENNSSSKKLPSTNNLKTVPKCNENSAKKAKIITKTAQRY